MCHECVNKISSHTEMNGSIFSDGTCTKRGNVMKPNVTKLSHKIDISCTWKGLMLLIKHLHYFFIDLQIAGLRGLRQVPKLLWVLSNKPLVFVHSQKLQDKKNLKFVFAYAITITLVINQKLSYQSLTLEYMLYQFTALVWLEYNTILLNSSIFFCKQPLLTSIKDERIVEQSFSSNLGYMLADQSYDVWRGNVHGSRFTKKHSNLTTFEAEFWTFSQNYSSRFVTNDQVIVF